MIEITKAVIPKMAPATVPMVFQKTILGVHPLRLSPSTSNLLFVHLAPRQRFELRPCGPEPHVLPLD